MGKGPRHPYATGTATKSFATSAPAALKEAAQIGQIACATGGAGGTRRLSPKGTMGEKVCSPRSFLPVISREAGYRQISVLGDYSTQD